MSRRDTILGAKDLDEEVVDVPEWGTDVLLRGMTGKQRIRIVDAGNEKGYMYSDLLLELCLDPDTRDPIFEMADREAIAGKSGGVLERLATKCLELSGVSIGDAEKEVEADPTSAGV